MKIYKPAPDVVLRIAINRSGDDAQYLTIDDCTKEEFASYVRTLIEAQGLSIFEKGKVTSVNIRDAIGKQNLQAISVSFKGLSPKQVHDLILNDLTEKENAAKTNNP